MVNVSEEKRLMVSHLIFLSKVRLIQDHSDIHLYREGILWLSYMLICCGNEGIGVTLYAQCPVTYSIPLRLYRVRPIFLEGGHGSLAA